MKLKNIFFAIVLFAIAVTGCDKITNPILPHAQNSTLPNTPPAFRDSSAAIGTYGYGQYKLLLEDCMGDQCSNCPLAIRIADSLLSPTGGYPYGQIVMIEENMGFEAIPTSSVVAGAKAGTFSGDYNSSVGDAWCKKFGIDAYGYPAGLINRLGYSNNMNLIYTKWLDSVPSIIQHTQQSVAINIHDSCWTSPRIIGVEFQITFVKPLSGTYALETLIVEDNVVFPQVLPSGYSLNFVHHNVLRGAFGNNTGGITTGIPIPTTSGTWTSYQTYDFTKGENGKAAGWNMANCYIVAFVYGSTGNTTNPWQVVQAEMIKVE